MPVTDADLAALAALDTPTVCNALEVVVPGRRATGFNRRPLVCPRPESKPVVGYARTAMIRCREPGVGTSAELRNRRLQYYEYIEKGPRPSIAILQDIEGPDRAMGAFWGEVQSNVHKGLGCLGVVTDGSIRDIDQNAEGFFMLAGAIMPSHVYADLVAIDVPVVVAGMAVAPGDLIHADRHGAVVVPAEAVREVPKAAATIARKEAILIGASRRPGFSTADLRKAFAEADEIH